jgi:hypothetical protein
MPRTHFAVSRGKIKPTPAMRAPVPPSLPFRGRFGAPRPGALDGLPLPPAAMPSHHGSRPLKAWRYVGVFAPELMVCAATVRVGPARQCFWAVWDRQQRRLYERTRLVRQPVSLDRGSVRVEDGTIAIDLELTETAGIESVCASGASYAWTRKQGGIEARGTISIDGARQAVRARAVVDDTAGYYERHTSWCWSAGVGLAADGRAVAWNLVEGVNDPERDSERTVWIDGEPVEVPRASFASDLSAVDGLRFSPEATRERRENLGLVRSSYIQPFGTFAGSLPGGLGELAQGFGVMEKHDARW